MSFKNYLIKTGLVIYIGAGVLAGVGTAKFAYNLRHSRQFDRTQLENTPPADSRITTRNDVVGVFGATGLGFSVSGLLLTGLVIGKALSDLEKKVR